MQKKWILISVLAVLVIGIVSTAVIIFIRNNTPPSSTPVVANGGENEETELVTVIAKNLNVPWGIAFLPDNNAIIAERETGKIMRMPVSGGSIQELLQIKDVNTGEGEGGLLGLAVSPTYEEDGYIYAYYSTQTDNRVVRLRINGESQPILTGIEHNDNHNGGKIAFGPDGKLYIGTGDAQNTELSQNMNSLNGKVLRINQDGTIPNDNPNPNSRIYSSGHRNIQGFAWDKDGRLWENEFGQDGVDEVNLIQPGKNYGWPMCEGFCSGASAGKFTDPVVTWPVEEASPSGNAIIGNSLYVAALRGTRLWRVPLAGDKAQTPQPLLLDQFGRLRTVVQAPDGSVWVTTSNRDRSTTLDTEDDKIIRIADISKL